MIYSQEQQRKSLRAMAGCLREVGYLLDRMPIMRECEDTGVIYPTYDAVKYDTVREMVEILRKMALELSHS